MEKRIAHFDDELCIEAYHFEGILQKFPNHFHEHYVIGFIENGCRSLQCKNKDYIVNRGDLILLNPLENHTCAQIDDKELDWRSINIESSVMRHITGEITGKEYLPTFTETVICQSETVILLKEIHDMIMKEEKGFQKEENFYFLLDNLITHYTEEAPTDRTPISEKIQRTCSYMVNHLDEPITLDDLSQIAGMNKYALLRGFTLQLGITPYQYYSSIRVNNAKRLLESGTALVDTALQCGFTDQSHFTRFFKNFIGLTPRFYQDTFRSWNENIQEDLP